MCKWPTALVVAVVAVVAVLVVAGSQPVKSAPGVGTIGGRVRLGVRPSKRPLPSSAYAPRQIVAQGAPGAELANVLIWVKDAPPSNVPTRRGEIRQRDEAFVPHVLAVPAGSTVRFPNDDPYFHNVFSLSRAASFDLGAFPQGESRDRVFTSPGIVKVFCHVHSHMTALIAVFDHPFFAQADAEGNFTIDRVPAGRYTLTAWHERAGGTDVAVNVDSGETTHLEIAVPIL